MFNNLPEDLDKIRNISIIMHTKNLLQFCFLQIDFLGFRFGTVYDLSILLFSTESQIRNTIIMDTKNISQFSFLQIYFFRFRTWTWKLLKIWNMSWSQDNQMINERLQKSKNVTDNQFWLPDCMIILKNKNCVKITFNIFALNSKISHIHHSCFSYMRFSCLEI